MTEIDDLPSCPECGEISWERREFVSQTRYMGGTVVPHTLDGEVVCTLCETEPNESDLDTLNEFFDHV